MNKDINRGINQVTSEQALEGPKDSFNEVFDMNIILIKNRIKKDLIIEEYFVGKYTKTKVGILYINTIVKKELVRNIKEKIKNISIDGIIDSSYLKKYLVEKESIFPTIISTERPDKTSQALLEGKIIILVDNSPYCLILPSFFQDFFHTTDDYYQKPMNITFIRIIRLLAFIISITTPAIYISVTTRNYQLVPLPLLLTLKAGRNYVPFPAYIEAIIMILSFEILKEGDIRKTNNSNSAISILGGLILGDAAVAAGIVSPIMIIVIAISSIAGLIFQSIELGNMIRFYKLLLLVLSTILGIYGVIYGIILLLYSLLKTKSFGYHYLILDKNEILDSFIKVNKKILKRNSKLTNNEIRGKL